MEVVISSDNNENSTSESPTGLIATHEVVNEHRHHQHDFTEHGERKASLTAVPIAAVSPELLVQSLAQTRNFLLGYLEHQQQHILRPTFGSVSLSSFKSLMEEAILNRRENEFPQPTPPTVDSSMTMKTVSMDSSTQPASQVQTSQIPGKIRHFAKPLDNSAALLSSSSMSSLSIHPQSMTSSSQPLVELPCHQLHTANNENRLSSSDIRERLKACVLSKQNRGRSSATLLSHQPDAPVATIRQHSAIDYGTDASEKIHKWMEQVEAPAKSIVAESNAKPGLSSALLLEHRRILRKTSSEPTLKVDPTNCKLRRLDVTEVDSQNLSEEEQVQKDSHERSPMSHHPLEQSFSSSEGQRHPQMPLSNATQQHSTVASPSRRRRPRNRSLVSSARTSSCRRQLSKPEVVNNEHPPTASPYPFVLLSKLHAAEGEDNPHLSLPNLSLIKGIMLRTTAAEASAPPEKNPGFIPHPLAACAMLQHKEEANLSSIACCGTPHTVSSTASSLSTLEQQSSCHESSPPQQLPMPTRKRRFHTFSRTLSAPLPLTCRLPPQSQGAANPTEKPTVGVADPQKQPQTPALVKNHVKAQLREKVLQRVHSSQNNLGQGVTSRVVLGRLPTCSTASSTLSSAPSITSTGTEDTISTLSSKQQYLLPVEVTSSATTNNYLNPISLPNAVQLPSPIQEEKTVEFPTPFHTAVVCEPSMLLHQCLCGNDSIHPENPTRLKAVLERLMSKNLLSHCAHLPCRKATMEEIQLCHTDAYSVLYGTNPINRTRICPHLLMSTNLCRLTCGGVGVDCDTVWNSSHTANAARMAAGCTIELVRRVALGEFRNGIALVRPPGHHAETQQALGFCYFNNIAIAARKLLHLSGTDAAPTSKDTPPLARREGPQTRRMHAQIKSEGDSPPANNSIQRILIVDWDNHHGNGTQQIFYSSASVLYVSLHRFEEGRFFPGTGAIEEVGEGAGVGFNINIAWSSSSDNEESTGMGDAEYMAAFRALVLPVAKEFAPDVVLVSAGFDGTKGNPAALGGYKLSPAVYGWMTWQLCQLDISNGKVALVLEGGYDVVSLCDAVEVCLQVLIDCGTAPLEGVEPVSVENKLYPLLALMDPNELLRRPSMSAVETILKVARVHSAHWKCLRTLEPLAVTRSQWEILQQQSLYFSTMPVPSIQQQINSFTTTSPNVLQQMILAAASLPSVEETPPLPLSAMASLSVNGSSPNQITHSNNAFT